MALEPSYTCEKRSYLYAFKKSKVGIIPKQVFDQSRSGKQRVYSSFLERAAVQAIVNRYTTKWERKLNSKGRREERDVVSAL